jgi:GrpB-like predicted nucleotidyltransferase (UPF0157 family)
VIEVVEYDEAWPVRAAAARADLISLGVFDAVEHIGSTSVPGLAAKPVIDLMAAAASLDAVAAAQDALAGLGYRRLEVGMPGRLFYYRDLRAHPADARRYAATGRTSRRRAGTRSRWRTTRARSRGRRRARRPRPARSAA